MQRNFINLFNIFKNIFKITDETLTYSPIFSVSQTIPNAYKKKSPHLNTKQTFFLQLNQHEHSHFYNHFWYDYLIMLDLCFRCTFYIQNVMMFSHLYLVNKIFQKKNVEIYAHSFWLVWLIGTKNTFTWAEIGKVFSSRFSRWWYIQIIHSV